MFNSFLCHREWLDLEFPSLIAKAIALTISTKWTVNLWSRWQTTIVYYIGVISNMFRELHEFWEHHLLLGKSESMELLLILIPRSLTSDHWAWCSPLREGLARCIDESKPRQYADVDELFSVELSHYGFSFTCHGEASSGEWCLWLHFPPPIKPGTCEIIWENHLR